MHEYKIETRGLPLDQASKALIMLHGRGGTSSDILNFSGMIADNECYIVAPEATYNSWYPYSFIEEEHKNEPWISSAVEIIERVIEETAIHIPLDKIFLVGFSQGACLSLETSARLPGKYGGIIAYSGGLIGKEINMKKYHKGLEGTKVFIGNSDVDPHIPLYRCEESAEIMTNLGAEVTFKVYPGMKHIINQDEINWAKALIERI